mmetsp:Transcript_49421/g.107901  ORF Transcript_49421/g.107901 Transcript_49421/m.107901 type:complete len:83 (+) Transcript_49421:1093-1341(+)
MVTVPPFLSRATDGTAMERAGECPFGAAARGGSGSIGNAVASYRDVSWTGSDLVKRTSGDKDLLSACKNVFFTQLCQFRHDS